MKSTSYYKQWAEQVWGLTTTVKGHLVLAHEGNPDETTIQARHRGFRASRLFKDNCPLCQAMKSEPGIILYRKCGAIQAFRFWPDGQVEYLVLRAGKEVS